MDETSVLGESTCSVHAPTSSIDRRQNGPRIVCDFGLELQPVSCVYVRLSLVSSVLWTENENDILTDGTDGNDGMGPHEALANSTEQRTTEWEWREKSNKQNRFSVHEIALFE